MAALVGLAACLADTPNQQAVPTISAAQAPEQRADIQHKIGQMLLVGFRGAEMSEVGPLAQQIRDGQIGGVILYDRDVPSGSSQRNIRSPEQIKALVDGLQGLTDDALFIAIDQEGGRVARLKEQYGFPPTVSQQELGRAGVEATRKQAEGIATTLHQLGINVNLAPVVDVNINPESPAIGALGRSFSADPNVVTDDAQVAIASHRQKGVLTAIKHFPGHGSAKADTHLGAVDISTTWSDVELEPYRSLINDRMVDMVMTAHVFNRNLDPSWPATLSPRTITGLLREQLGFNGVVITDDMQMAAIAEHYSFETALRQAVLAGVDIISFANNNSATYDPNIAVRAIDIIASLVEDGTISEARLDQSVARLQALKRRLAK